MEYQGRLIGIDMNPNAKKWENSGFEIYIGDQSDCNFWNSVKEKIGKIDILLDDGGHTYAQQINTTASMIDEINDDGLIIVEDTHTSYMSGFGYNKHSFIHYVKKMIDEINARFNQLNHKKLKIVFGQSKYTNP